MSNKTRKIRKPREDDVKIYIMDKHFSDEDMEKREGTYFQEKEIPKIIDHDADIYVVDSTCSDGKRLIAKLRTNVFPKELTELGWDAFHKTASASRNRGAAAGPIDLKSMYWKKRKPIEISKWSTQYIQDGKISKMRVNNNVYSSVLGYYEKTPFMGLPCRLTSYTQSFFKYYRNGLPFICAIDRQFKKLIPSRYKKQLDRILTQPEYQIEDTAFSSITLNRNFRTALHKDDGDFKEGFGNLTVIERGKYHGAYTCFPQYGVGFDLRTGGFLAMDVHEWHCNTEYYETSEDKEFNKNLPNVFSHSLETGTQGANFPFSRLSFVCYLREKLISCDPKQTHKYYKKIGFDPIRGKRPISKTRKQK